MGGGIPIRKNLWGSLLPKLCSISPTGVSRKKTMAHSPISTLYCTKKIYKGFYLGISVMQRYEIHNDQHFPWLLKAVYS